ncbi:serine/threonine-protein kinase [Actinoallomurus acanthiterrae]
METTSEALGGAILPPGAQPLEPADPAEIGGYRLAGRLASGGTGVVYLARDGRGGLLAVKTARAQKTEQAQELRRLRTGLRTEAACARRLPSFCTAQLLVDGTDQTRPYLISEYVEGPSLHQFIQDVGPLKPAQVKALAVAVARALAAIHQAGLVHCDLKPAHVLLAADGPRLIDFGIAQEIPASGRSTPIATVADSSGWWRAPELAIGGPVSAASDVFGWGCLVGYATTGRSPFAEADELGRQSIPQPTRLDAWDEPIRGLVEAALARDPADRPTADELASRLDAVSRPTIARPPEPGTAILPTPRPVPDPAARAATDPAPTPNAEPTTAGARRPRRAKALVMVSVPAALIAVLATVIATTGRDAGRHTPLDPGPATPSGHGATGSPAELEPRSSRPGVRHPASVGGTHATPGSPTSNRPSRHIGHSKSHRPNTPSGPGGTSAPRPPTVSASPTPSSPRPTPSTTPSPTTTKSG